jgi:hypothetical protein
MIISASCYFVPEYYNPRLRATVPPVWKVELDNPLPGCNVASEFVGDTRADALRNAIDCFKSRGITGRLRLHN